MEFGWRVKASVSNMVTHEASSIEVCMTHAATCRIICVFLWAVNHRRCYIDSPTRKSIGNTITRGSAVIDINTRKAHSSQLASSIARTEQERCGRCGRQFADFPLEELNFMLLYHNVGPCGAERFSLKKIVKPLKFQKINISRMPSGAQYEFST